MAKKAQAAAESPAGGRKVLGCTAWAVLAGAWLLVAVSLVSYDPADPLPEGWPGQFVVQPGHAAPANWAGLVGAAVAHKVYLVIGPGIWVAMAGTLSLLVLAAMRRPVNQIILRVVGVTLMTVATSAITGLLMPNGVPLLFNRPEGTGNLLAFLINHELTVRFSTIGSLVILAVVFWVGAILAADRLVLALPAMLLRFFSGAAAHVHMPKPVLVGRFPALWGRRNEPDNSDANAAPRSSKRRSRNEVEEPIDEDAGGLGGVDSFDPDEYRRHERADNGQPVVDEVDAVAEDADNSDGQNVVQDEEDVGHDAPGAYLAEKANDGQPFDPDALRAKIKALPINFAPKAKPGAAPRREIDLSGYRFPGMDLLVEPEGAFTQEMEQVVRDQAMLLEGALQQYRIEGEVVGIDSGPVITLYEIRLAPGTKVSQLGAVSSDLARALKAQNIRIVPNMVGKDTVGIEVPNIKKEKVRLKELMNSNNETIAKMGLPMFLGKDASGNPLIADLAAMPHMLIAGTTGSGKSVCMNSIIMSFLLTKRPDELKLVLVDPKMVEMSQFKDIPHLMCPVVTEMGKAAAILEWATTKMDERYELLAEAGVRDVASYNGLGWEELKERFSPSNEEEEARIPKKLPYLVFVIDELADLMMTNKEVEGFIVRIAQKARAVGMHLILATQRPQANVVTGLIKSNMPCRVAFKVASGMDSRIVLDQKGAELLLGQGDMLYLSPRTSKLTRAQGTLVDDMEIRRAVKFLKELAEQNFEPQLVQLRGAAGDVDEEAAKDPLFDDAVRCVLQTKRGSVSLLQRRLTIGYSRASRLIEAMAMAGILGEYKGSQAREVNITVEEWEAMRAQMLADAAETEANGTIFQKQEEPEEAFDAGDDEDDGGGVPDEMEGEHRQ